MQTTTASLNGVNVEQLQQTVDAIETQPGLAEFEFRATNEWMDCGHNRSTIQGFHGAGQEDTTRTRPFVLTADEPPVLLGEDAGANPVEYVLHALAACLTTSMVYHAAARGIEIKGVESALKGQLDLRGFLGLSKDVRQGYREITASFRVKTAADAEQLRKLMMNSPVYDIVTNPVPVRLDIRVEDER